MKSELEPQDIEIIAQRVVQLLKPILSQASKGDAGGDSIFTVETVAEYLKVDPTWVYKQVSIKTLPYFKSGKYIRFRKREIDLWIGRQTVNPIPSSAPTLKIINQKETP
jgi:excisionase family DNA binding protein